MVETALWTVVPWAPGAAWCACDAVMDGMVPSSERSRAALSRVRLPLDKRLVGKHLGLGAPAFLRIFKESSELEVWVESNGAYGPFEIDAICKLSGEWG